MSQGLSADDLAILNQYRRTQAGYSDDATRPDMTDARARRQAPSPRPPRPRSPVITPDSPVRPIRPVRPVRSPSPSPSISEAFTPPYSLRRRGRATSSGSNPRRRLSADDVVPFLQQLPPRPNSPTHQPNPPYPTLPIPGYTPRPSPAAPSSSIPAGQSRRERWYRSWSWPWSSWWRSIWRRMSAALGLLVSTLVVIWLILLPALLCPRSRSAAATSPGPTLTPSEWLVQHSLHHHRGYSTTPPRLVPTLDLPGLICQGEATQPVLARTSYLKAASSSSSGHATAGLLPAAPPWTGLIPDPAPLSRVLVDLYALWHLQNTTLALFGSLGLNMSTLQEAVSRDSIRNTNPDRPASCWLFPTCTARRLAHLRSLQHSAREIAGHLSREQKRSFGSTQQEQGTSRHRRGKGNPQTQTQTQTQDLLDQIDGHLTHLSKNHGALCQRIQHAGPEAYYSFPPTTTSPPSDKVPPAPNPEGSRASNSHDGPPTDTSFRQDANSLQYQTAFSRTYTFCAQLRAALSPWKECHLGSRPPKRSPCPKTKTGDWSLAVEMSRLGERGTHVVAETGKTIQRLTDGTWCNWVCQVVGDVFV